MSRIEQSPKPGKVQRALIACQDALGYLSQPAATASLDFIYVDRLLSSIVEPPSDAKQKNGRRGVSILRQWMIEEGPGVALLEVLGQLLWRVVDMSSDQVKSLRQALQANPRYLSLIYDPRSTELVLERIERVRQNKVKACVDFRNNLLCACTAVQFSTILFTDTLQATARKTPRRRMKRPRRGRPQERRLRLSCLRNIFPSAETKRLSSSNRWPGTRPSLTTA